MSDDYQTPSREDAAAEPENGPESDEQPDGDQTPDLAEQLAQALSERDRAVAELTRHRVAAEHQVPADLLVGSSEDELRASAERLAEFAKSQRGVPDFGAGRRGEEPNRDPDPVRSALRRGR